MSRGETSPKEKTLLLDTHALIWYSVNPERLPESVLERLRDTEQRIFVSSISAWEISIKVRLGKLPQAKTLYENFHLRLAQYGFSELPFTSVHALAEGGLEYLHKDPFDRALAAQAVSEQLALVSSDEVFTGVPDLSVWWGA